VFENLEKGWVPLKKNVQATKRGPNTPIPSTRDWTINELEFFKLHYYQVNDTSLWTQVFCPSAPLTDVAKDVIGMNLSNRAIVEGNYMHLPFHLQVFAQLLFAALLPHRREPIADHLITYLLQACNPDNILLPEPGMRYITQVGEFEFVSIPDVTVDIRMLYKPFVGSSLIVVEDKLYEDDELDVDGNKVVPLTNLNKPVPLTNLNKPDPVKSGEYQLPGEMVAAAMRNYTHESKQLAQTIFALRVVGTHVTFYRADFPIHYLESIKQGEPADDITIFRFGGEYNTNNLGLLVDSKDREIVVRWICNIMAAALKLLGF
jgi:hypothetical protein